MALPYRPRRRPSTVSAGLSGAVGAAVGLATAEVLAAAIDALPSLVDTAWTDAGVESVTAQAAATVGVVLLVGAAIGVVASRRPGAALLGLASLWAGAGALVVGDAGAAVSGGAALASLATSLGATVGLIGAAPSGGPTSRHRSSRAASDRRGFLILLAGAGASSVLAIALGSRLARRDGAPPERAAQEPRPRAESRPERSTTTRPDPEVVEVPADIDATGSSDVGRALTSWLASAVGSARVVRFAPGGTYRIDDGSVVVEDASDLVLDFAGATLLRTRVLDRHLRYPERHGYLRLTGSATDVTVRDLRVRGVNVNDGSVEDQADGEFPAGHRQAGTPYFLTSRPTGADGDERRSVDTPAGKESGEWGVYSAALEFEHGVDIENGRDVVVEDCELVGPFGDGVNTIGQQTDGVVVRRVVVDRNGRQGITMVAGHRLTVHDCEIRHSRRAGIDLEPDSADVDMGEVEIRDNLVNSHLLAFASAGPGRIDDVWIHDNVVDSRSLPTLYVQSNDGAPRSRWRFERNRVTPELGSGAALDWRAGVRLGNVHDSRITENTIRFEPDAEEMAGVVLLEGCRDIAVHDNDFRGADHAVVDRAEGGSSTRSTWQATGNVSG